MCVHRYTHAFDILEVTQRLSGILAKLVWPGAALRRAHLKTKIPIRIFYAIIITSCLLTGNSITKHDGKLIQCPSPISNRYCPFFRYIFNGQIKHFHNRIFSRKLTAIFNCFTQCTVKWFNNIGGINNPSNVFRIIKEWDNFVPMSAPWLYYSWIFVAPV